MNIFIFAGMTRNGLNVYVINITSLPPQTYNYRY